MADTISRRRLQLFGRSCRLSTMIAVCLLQACTATAPPAQREILSEPLVEASAVPSAPLPSAEDLLRLQAENTVLDHLVLQGFNRDELQAVLGHAQKREDILVLISKPAEAKPWKDYAPIFTSEARLQNGVNFWRSHEQSLRYAQTEWGVEPEIVCAIIGVETNYGRNQGRFPVLDALTTLAFYYPARSAYFSAELEQFFLLAREQQWQADVPMGSYAGAMGWGQFMPSSYRNWAVDYDGDGRIELAQNADDAIASVANYFRGHGWQQGAAVMALADLGSVDVTQSDFEFYPKAGYKTLAQWREQGVQIANGGAIQNDFLSAHAKKGLAKKPALLTRKLKSIDTSGAGRPTPLAADEPALLLQYEESEAMRYYLGFNNFAVITQYNRSTLYARSVYEFAQRLKVRHDGLMH